METQGKIIILEGSEQCGKTTLARKIEDEFKAFYFHGSRPADGCFEIYHSSMLNSALYFAEQGHTVVIDRCFISHEVYNTLFDGAPEYDTKRLFEEFESDAYDRGIPFLIVYCKPDREFDKNMREEMYDDSDGSISRKFDEVMETFGLGVSDNIILYNWKAEPTGKSIINKIKELDNEF